MAKMEKRKKPKSNLEILREYAAQRPVDVIGAANAIGVHVVVDDLPDGISGKIQRLADGRYQIVANRREPEYRRRFTIAHELGHYMYHRSLIGDGVSDSPAYRAPDETIYETTPLERVHERQANQFAANLLMPKALIRRAEVDHPGIGVADLARLFNVSEDAMRIRKGLPTLRQLELQNFEVVEIDD